MTHFDDPCRRHASLLPVWLARHQILLTIVFLSAAGCNQGLASVGGTVTLDGAPVEGSADMYGTVNFVRQQGGGAPAVGIIKHAGQYTLATGSRQGIEPGAYLVGIAVKRVHPPATPGGLTRPELISPAKYASVRDSGLRAEVKPGSNTFDFALVSAQNK